MVPNMSRRQKLLTILLCLTSSLLTFVLTAACVTAFAAGVFVWGDANGDGVVDSKDLSLLRRYLAAYDYSTGTSTVKLGPACTHQYEDTVTLPTCTTPGYTTHVCSLCGDTYTDSETPALGHDYSASYTVDVPATRSTAGSKSRHCTRCDAVTDVTVIPVLASDKLYYVDADGSVLFGTYPQTRVTDTTLAGALTKSAGALPTTAMPGKWTSCKPVVNGTPADTMWYVDVTNGGDTYRGIYFTQYRPYWTEGAAGAAGSWQDDNGYATGTVYWFRFEPIRWRKVANGDGAWLLFSDLILDSREFDSSGSDSYEESAIRAWLNETFISTAFTSAEAALIRRANVPNSAVTTNPDGSGSLWNGGKNENTCRDTSDRVFLLSVQEITAKGYGFSSYSVADLVRTKKVSGYAAALGAFVDDNGAGMWWLRSPDCDSAEKAHAVYTDGFADLVSSVTDAGCGVVPALWIEY